MKKQLTTPALKHDVSTRWNMSYSLLLESALKLESLLEDYWKQRVGSAIKLSGLSIYYGWKQLALLGFLITRHMPAIGATHHHLKSLSSFSPGTAKMAAFGVPKAPTCLVPLLWPNHPQVRKQLLNSFPLEKVSKRNLKVSDTLIISRGSHWRTAIMSNFGAQGRQHEMCSIPSPHFALVYRDSI